MTVNRTITWPIGPIYWTKWYCTMLDLKCTRVLDVPILHLHQKNSFAPIRALYFDSEALDSKVGHHAIQSRSPILIRFKMAFRSRALVVLETAGKAESVISGEGGLRGFMHRVRERFSTGKLLRPDVEDDVLRKPVTESKFRFPSPG